jgi:Protein of unknown function (DUF4232)
MLRSSVATVVVAMLVAGCSGTPPTPIDPGATGSAAPSATPSATTSAVPSPVNQGAGSGNGTSGGTPNCQPGELRASLGQQDGAAGSVNVALLLTNTGSRTCRLRGFPGVSYVTGDDGHQVGPAAAMSGPRGDEIVLAPGKAAQSLLRLVNVANYDAAACSPTPVRGLRIYPPGDTASLYVERPGTGCAGTPPGDQIQVQTLTAA